ncbi:ABC transporter substrate-binding protein [Amycolatopsis aidingensis]|uniref:ABC transporter substrate-binding protein n=1 Tax=Amycolatopsis aidingensis TaxID=2842453 RepID=UPI001C0DCA6F|nr:extracellular solute-binding protein [Amycolatopsis aidingensis]
MVRRSVGTALGAAVAALTLAACGTTGPAAGGAGGVTVWALQDPALNPVEQESIERFNSGTDGRAKLETFVNDPYKQKLRVSLGSPNAPDVFFNWGGGNLAEYVDAGKVADLTPVLEADPELQSAFIPSVLETARLDGRYYGIPMRGMQPVVLFYNKKVFADAGVQAPRTWADLLAAVDGLKEAGVTPIALPGAQAWTELMWAEYVLDRLAGPEVFQTIRQDGPAGWRDPAVLAAMTKLGELLDRGAFGANFSSLTWDDSAASTLLAQGRAGMMLMGSWEYSRQLEANPEFVEGGDLGWLPFPAISGGEGDPGNVVGNPTNFYSVTAGAPEAATEFVSTTLHDPEYVDALIAAGDVPTVTGIEDKLAAAPNADFTTWVYGLVRDAPNFQLSWDQDLPAADAEYLLTQLQEFFLGNLTPQAFVDALASR